MNDNPTFPYPGLRHDKNTANLQRLKLAIYSFVSWECALHHVFLITTKLKTLQAIVKWSPYAHCKGIFFFFLRKLPQQRLSFPLHKKQRNILGERLF